MYVTIGRQEGGKVQIVKMNSSGLPDRSCKAVKCFIYKLP